MESVFRSQCFGILTRPHWIHTRLRFVASPGPVIRMAEMTRPSGVRRPVGEMFSTQVAIACSAARSAYLGCRAAKENRLTVVGRCQNFELVVTIASPAFLLPEGLALATPSLPGENDSVPESPA